MKYQSGVKNNNSAMPEHVFSIRYPEIILPVLFVIIVAPSLGMAQVYKWEDEEGRIYYGDKPMGNNSDKLEIKRHHTSGKANLRREAYRQRLLHIMGEERQEKKRRREESSKQARDKKLNCNLAKHELVSIENSSYLMEQTDDPYNPKILSDSERLSATDDARKTVNYWCSG